MEHDRDTPLTGGRPDEVGRHEPIDPPGAETGALGSIGRSGMTGETDPTGSRAGSYDRTFTGDEHGSTGERIDEGIERVSDAVESGKERVAGAMESGRNRVAGQLESLGDRIEERARDMEDAGGIQRRAGHVALRASDALDTSAEYIRSHDAAEMRDDLERAIRDRPLFSVGVAVGAGFLIGRLLRD
jgi:ElaB/YqjD/DUF883 family membrane-anchored ribosome-binding protein